MDKTAKITQLWNKYYLIVVWEGNIPRSIVIILIKKTYSEDKMKITKTNYSHWEYQMNLES